MALTVDFLFGLEIYCWSNYPIEPNHVHATAVSSRAWWLSGRILALRSIAAVLMLIKGS